MKNILVSIDFSMITSLVLKQAAHFRHTFQSKIWLFHVAAPNPDFVGYEAGLQVVRDQRANELRQEHQQLQTLKTKLQEQGLLVEVLLVQGITLDTLIKKTKELNIDLILLGIHQHSLLYRIFVDRTSELLLQQAPCPLLFIPEAQPEEN